MRHPREGGDDVKGRVERRSESPTPEINALESKSFFASLEKFLIRLRIVGHTPHRKNHG
jgi:hypothetical protein